MRVHDENLDIHIHKFTQLLIFTETRFKIF